MPLHAQVQWRSGPALERLPLLGRAAPVDLAERLEALAGPDDRGVAAEMRHVLLRFSEPLRDDDRAELEAGGVVLGAFVGDSTYFAALDRAMLDAPRVAQLERLDDVFEIQRQWKLHPDLAAGTIHPWTVLDDDFAAGKKDELPAKLRPDQPVALIVLFHGDVGLEPRGLAIVRQLGGRVLSSIHSLNGMVIALPQSRINELADRDEVLYLEPPLPALTGTNQESRAAHQVNDAQTAPYNLSGAGVDVLVYDTGRVYGHADLAGRVTIGIGDGSGISNHSTHVAGTVGGDGSLSGTVNRGMAPGVDIISFSFETGGPLQPGFLYTDPGDIESDYLTAVFADGADVSNNSIGSNVAGNGFPCEWEGDYGVTAALIDAIVGGSLGAPFPIVWAAGNERGSGRCGSTFSTIPPPSGAKNHIAVGAMNSVAESISFFSSIGPTDDGRLKPEVVASGCQVIGDGGVTSTSATVITGANYSTLCGTSMAAPAVTGIIALILEDYAAQFPLAGPPLPGTLKALLAHTAKDLGAPGPDYTFGYGSVQTVNAIDIVRAGQFTEGEVGQDDRNVSVAVIGAGEAFLKVTLAWADVAGTPNVIPSLVNDLDLVVTSPTGVQHYPWTLGGAANPGDPAIRAQANRTDILEQVMVDNPEPGSWLIEVVGFDVPSGPQSFGLVASAPIQTCADLGLVGFDASSYACESVAILTIVDCGPNLDAEALDTLQAVVTSTSDPVGQTIDFVEVSVDSGAFIGAVALGGGIGVPVIEGDAVTLTYSDADDGSGQPAEIVAQAIMDCSPAEISDVVISEVSGLRAVLSFTTSEPALAQVNFGSSCGALNQQLSEINRGTSHSFELTGLEPSTTYFLELRATDEAGNLAIDDQLGLCHSFETLELPKIATEFFDGFDFDLEFTSLLFTPIPGPDRYQVCATPITDLPVDPLQGNLLTMNDDSPLNASIPVEDGKRILLFGAAFDDFFPNPNGHITFSTGDFDWTPSLFDHFRMVRISGLFIDLSPQNGIVSWDQLDDRIVVSFFNVPQYQQADSNTFQYELFFDGRIRLSYLQVDAANAMVGLSGGGGVPLEFLENNLSEEFVCGPVPPWSFQTNQSTPLATSLDVDLGVMDDGDPQTLTATIEQLPQEGVLVDPSGGGLIESAPFVLPPGVTSLRYVPLGAFRGTDFFRVFADDGGVMPTGGVSPSTSVVIDVGGLSTVETLIGDGIHESFELDALWVYGLSFGQGGVFEAGGGGFPDPDAGVIGAFVLGYNTFGNYPASLSTPHYATAGPFDLSQSQSTQLDYQRWLGVEDSAFDHASVEVSNDGGMTWNVIWENPDRSLTGGDWEPVSHNIHLFADLQPDVRVRFAMGPTDGSINYCGWSLDDMHLRGLTPIEECPGDANFDREVDFADITQVLTFWLTFGATQREGDANADGVTNFADITAVLVNWSQTCGPL